MGQIGQRAKDIHAAAIAVDPGNEVFVEFDDIRLQLRPQAQAGSTITEIVERQSDPLVLEYFQRALQAFGILDPFMLGQLEHQVRWRNARFHRDLEEMGPAIRGERQDRRCAQIDEQAFAQLRPTIGPDRRQRGLTFEFHQIPKATGGSQ